MMSELSHLQAFTYAQQGFPHWATQVLQHIVSQRCNGQRTLMFDLPQNHECIICCHCKYHEG